MLPSPRPDKAVCPAGRHVGPALSAVQRIGLAPGDRFLLPGHHMRAVAHHGVVAVFSTEGIDLRSLRLQRVHPVDGRGGDAVGNGLPHGPQGAADGGSQQVVLGAVVEENLDFRSGRDNTAQGRRSCRVRPGEGVGSVSTGRIGKEAQAAGAAGPVVGVGRSPELAGRGDCHVAHVVGRAVVAPVAGVGVCRHAEGAVEVVRTDRQGTDRRRGVHFAGPGSGHDGVGIEGMQIEGAARRSVQGNHGVGRQADRRQGACGCRVSRLHLRRKGDGCGRRD